MLAIYKKEMRSYFINPIGYIYVGIFLALSALVCCYSTLQSNTYDTSVYFFYMIFALIILIPLLTMRSFAEEKKMRTEQMLMTAPISTTEMVLGKYFAALTMFVGSLLVSCINFLPLYIVADEEKAAAATAEQAANIGPSTPYIVGSIIGMIFLGAAFVAIGVFISALTENQLSAAVSTIAVVAFLVSVGLVNQIGSDEEGTRLISSYAVRSVLDWVSVLSRFGNFKNGLLDFAAIFYFLSFAFVFIFLTVRVYEKRRWG